MQSIFDDLRFLTTVQHCHTTEQLTCLNRLLIKHATTYFCPEKIKPACVAVVYDVFVQQSKLLPDIMKVINPKILAKNRNRSTNEQANWATMKESLVLVNVYMKDKLETLIVDTQTIVVSDLILNFGSTVGVMLGMSFTSIFEVSFQLFGHLGQKIIIGLHKTLKKLKSLKRTKVKKLNPSLKRKL